MKDMIIEQLRAEIKSLKQFSDMKDDLIKSQRESIRVLLEMVKGYQKK